MEVLAEDLTVREIASKNLDGITDLVVVAPIRSGFIEAYENITYATRLQIVAEALHRIRQSAREHEFTVPFSDTTERILTLLDFRVGVLDRDLFNLDLTDGLKARRYLYLTATFDGAWEPYMRLIWRPLGFFLDLLFCNCEGYVTAGDHDFPQYAQWVRDHQVDSSIFYSTTGFTVKDQLYLSKLERLSHETGGDAGDLAITRMTMTVPEDESAAERGAAVAAALQGSPPDFRPMFKIHELALEALTVLFKLADYYPPEWLIKPKPGELRNEGIYLARVAHSLLEGWPSQLLTPEARKAYQEPLEWFESALRPDPDAPARKLIDPRMQRYPDPDFESLKTEVQGGMIRPQGSEERPVQAGAMLLMTITDTMAARKFVAGLKLHFEGEDGDKGMFRTIAVTAEGLKRFGMDPDVVRRFPKEFREGMATRSGLIGDVRENHPRRWSLPPRNWPPRQAGDGPRPPVEISEVDFVIQLRYAPNDAAEDCQAIILHEIETLATAGGVQGVALAGYVPMFAAYKTDAQGERYLEDQFGFRDGISQPKVVTEPDKAPVANKEVRLGELLCGYRNDRDDFATPDPYFEAPPSNYDTDEKDDWDRLEWRRHKQKSAAHFQLNGSYLVVRKLEQHPGIFRAFLDEESKRIRAVLEDQLGRKVEFGRGDLAAALLGRQLDGTPLVAATTGEPNGFDYAGDQSGTKCPFAAHIRRANPRTSFQDRPTPRIVRRGMSYRDEDSGECGLIFQCYNASIAEQYETIQRWINGGNSTGISAAQGDPLMGVGPKTGDRLFRFEWLGKTVRVRMPQAFVSLHWGLYLFVPSRSAIRDLCNWPKNYFELDASLENRGADKVDLIQSLPEIQRPSEWKRLLEDFYAKDPAELGEMPDVWSAIRWYAGGSYRIDGGSSGSASKKAGPVPRLRPQREDAASAKPKTPPEAPRPTVLTASKDHALRVLADWKAFTVEEQLSRIVETSGSIYVTQQPDDVYGTAGLAEQSNYRQEAGGTNAILIGYSEAEGFDVGYRAGKVVLDEARRRALAVPVTPPLDYFKLELRRQYLMPALGRVCSEWFGLPDAANPEDAAIMRNGGWNWNPATDPANPEGASLRTPQCPGDCLSPSRATFYPNPTPTISMFARDHGPAIRKAGRTFVNKHVDSETAPPGSFAQAMFKLQQKGELTTDGFARNLIGIMVGAMPPMEGNLRGILLEWLTEQTLWRHQGAYIRAKAEPGKALHDAAHDALYKPMVNAMCKRPAPDLIYRKATQDVTLPGGGNAEGQGIEVKKDDLVVVSLVSVAQRSLRSEKEEPGERVSIIFGGRREKPWQGEYEADGKTLVDPKLPVHACPAQNLAMGAMMGILAALLEAGEIRALPASLIVKISALQPV